MLRLFGERDCRSWPSFSCLIRNLCTSALPPPKPKPLLLQAARGLSVERGEQLASAASSVCVVRAAYTVCLRAYHCV